MATSFSDIQATILKRGRLYGTCSAFHQAVIATDFNTLLSAAMAVVTIGNPWIWLTKTGIITDDILASYDQTVLNAAGIYTTGTASITNPTTDIILTGNANVTITLTGTVSVNIYVLENAQLTLVCGDTSFAEIATYSNSVINITANNNATVCLQTRDASTSTLTLKDSSNTTVEARNKSIVNITATDTCFLNASGFMSSIITISLPSTPILQEDGQVILTETGNQIALEPPTIVTNQNEASTITTTSS